MQKAVCANNAVLPSLPSPPFQVVSFWSSVLDECTHLLVCDSLALRVLGGALLAEVAANFPLPAAAATVVACGGEYVDVGGIESAPMEVEVGVGGCVGGGGKGRGRKRRGEAVGQGGWVGVGGGAGRVGGAQVVSP